MIRRPKVAQFLHGFSIFPVAVKQRRLEPSKGFPENKSKSKLGLRRRTATMEHTHDLLVEIEENNISRLKIKLLRYFQSKKSNGGECDVEYADGARTAVLRFRREEGEFVVIK